MATSSSSRPDRRSFLASLGALSGFAFFPKAAGAERAATSVARASSSWDLSWLDKLNGRHRQLFDYGDTDVTGESHLIVVRNYLNAHKEVFGLDYPDINAIVGIAHAAYPINASTALWEKYPIGELWKIKDPTTNAWAKHNVFNDASQSNPKGPYTIQALVSRGTVFWQCNYAFSRVVKDVAAAAGKPENAVRADLLEGMMPGVHLVPAHTMLVGLAQEHGFTYEAM